jgi:hypothetical protein
VQIFVLAADGTVLHALPGFWHPEDLARELRFALLVARLWADETRTLEEKGRMFRLLHIAELRRQPPATYARSAWQHFDEWAEIEKLRDDPDRDTLLTWEQAEGTQAAPKPRLKPLNVVAHQRMVAQPFRSYEDFDVEAFVDYGRHHYDLNRGQDGDGRVLAGQRKLRHQREREAQRAAQLAARAQRR